jgi:hypothetical protein
MATTRPSYVGAKPGLLSFSFDVPTFTKHNAPLAVPQSTRGGFHLQAPTLQLPVTPSVYEYSNYGQPYASLLSQQHQPQFPDQTISGARFGASIKKTQFRKT